MHGTVNIKFGSNVSNVCEFLSYESAEENTRNDFIN